MVETKGTPVKIDCQYAGDCTDEGVGVCSSCKWNNGKKSHYCPETLYISFPYYPYYPYQYNPYPGTVTI